jgi:hypothetical protein
MNRIKLTKKTNKTQKTGNPVHHNIKLGTVRHHKQQQIQMAYCDEDDGCLIVHSRTSNFSAICRCEAEKHVYKWDSFQRSVLYHLH